MENSDRIDYDSLMEAIKELRKEIEKLNKEIADREQCSIDQHAEIHEYRDEIHEIKKKLTKVAIERDAAIADLEMLKCSISCESNQSYSNKPFIECYKNGKKKYCRWS